RRHCHRGRSDGRAFIPGRAEETVRVAGASGRGARSLARTWPDRAAQRAAVAGCSVRRGILADYPALWLAPAVSAIRADPGGLDELAAARLAEGRAILLGLAGEHDELLTAAIAERDRYTRMAAEAAAPAMRALEQWDAALEDRIARLTAEQRRCLLFALAERLAAGGDEYSRFADWFREVTESPLDLAAGDVRLLAAVAEPGAGSGGYRPFEFVVDSAAVLG